MKRPTADDLRPLLTEREAAPLLGASVQRLRTDRSAGTGAFADLPHYKLGRSIRYDPRDIQRWLERHRREGAAA